MYMMSEEEKKKKSRERAKQYYEKNKKKILEKQKIYKRKRYQSMTPEEKKVFLEKRKPIIAKYRSNNCEKFREYQRNYKKRKIDRGEIPKNKNQLIEELKYENIELRKDLIFVLEQTLGAFTKNWCIDWNFTDIRKKYNLEGDSNE